MITVKVRFKGSIARKECPADSLDSLQIFPLIPLASGQSTRLGFLSLRPGREQSPGHSNGLSNFSPLGRVWYVFYLFIYLLLYFILAVTVTLLDARYSNYPMDKVGYYWPNGSSIFCVTKNSAHLSRFTLPSDTAAVTQMCFCFATVLISFQSLSPVAKTPL